MKDYTFPDWIEYTEAKKEVKVKNMPSYEEIDTPVDVQMIVEYYSR